MARVEKNGRVVIPAPLRRALGLQPGDEVVVSVAQGELRLATRDHAIAAAQDKVRHRVGAGTSLVDELIRERRAEARSK